MKLVIGYLYPDLMNIYGDTGNIIALKKRAEWRGIEVEIKNRVELETILNELRAKFKNIRKIVFWSQEYKKLTFLPKK